METAVIPPKPKAKPVERNDYEVTILFNDLIDDGTTNTGTVLQYKNMAKSDILYLLEKLADGFIEEVDGVLHRYTKYNILHIRATKKEKNENKQLQGEGQETAADGAGSPS